MKVLQIDVSAIRDKFYLNLFTMLSQSGVIQTVYTPYRTKEYNQNELNWAFSEYKRNNIDFVVAPIKTVVDRVMYIRKVSKYFKYLDSNCRLRNYDIVHAHSLYSDGGVAYQCNIKYKLPYIVAVRSTDIEFMKYFPILKEYACNVLENASKIVYLSADLKEETIKRLFHGDRKLYRTLESKSLVIPNGVNRFWMDRIYDKKRSINSKKFRILQVSRLERRKQIDKTILAVRELKGRGYNCSLTIVGDGSQKRDLENLVRKNKLEDSIFFLGYISDKEQLLKEYRTADIFCMPSKGETFGIVYIEAMTQGLPVLGIKGTGVSSYFKNNEVGYFTETVSGKKIADGIEKIIQNYSTMTGNTLKYVNEFNWDIIIKQYLTIYNANSIKGLNYGE